MTKHTLRQIFGLMVIAITLTFAGCAGNSLYNPLSGPPAAGAPGCNSGAPASGYS